MAKSYCNGNFNNLFEYDIFFSTKREFSTFLPRKNEAFFRYIDPVAVPLRNITKKIKANWEKSINYEFKRILISCQANVELYTNIFRDKVGNYG